MKKLFSKLFPKKVVIEHTPVQTSDQTFWYGGAFAIGQQVVDHKGRKGTVTNKLGFASKYSHFEVLLNTGETKLITASNLRKVMV